MGSAAPLPADLAARCGRPVNIGHAGALAPWDEGWWRFDETSGLALDCVSTNNGTLAGTGSLPQRVPGKGRYALYFQSTNYVSVTPPLSHLNGALTVAAWVKPDSPPKVGRVIASNYRWVAPNKNRGWLLGNDSGNTDWMSFKICSPAGDEVSAKINGFFGMWSNKWVHVAGVFKPGAYVALYTNGGLAAVSNTAVTAISTTNTNLRIGLRADNTGQGQWSGLIEGWGVGCGLCPHWYLTN